MNADRLAKAYRWIEYLVFGRLLERCRTQYLDSLAGAKQILVVGEGDGRFLEALLTRNRQARVVVFESSQRMIALAESKIRPEDRERVDFALVDARACNLPADRFDAIVTNFFLDCLSAENADAFVQKAAAGIKPGGVWIVGEFHKPERGCARLHATLWIGTMYRFFRATTGLRTKEIPAYPAMLRANGFDLVDQRTWRMELVVSQLWRKCGTGASAGG